MANDSNQVAAMAPTEQSAGQAPLRPDNSLLIRILEPLASLRITVALLAMAIFIVFAGTLAQAEQDIWHVIHQYFRMDLSSFRAAWQTAFPWIELQVFFPRSFFPNMKPFPPSIGFPFPNGWLIGLLLFINLLAAHVVRFRVLARGTKLGIGLVISAIGLLLMLLVIHAGSEMSADQIQLFTDWPSLRILWLLTKCSAVSLVLLGGFALLFHERAGLVLLHAGVGLLMIGELLVGIGAVESQMQIIEGQTVNFALDTREIELAVLDRSDPKTDSVVAVPQSRLRAGAEIEDDYLPFEIQVVQFMANSNQEPVTDKKTNPATAGTGRATLAVAAPAISGTDKSGRTNNPAAYIGIVDKASKKNLGTYLLTLNEWMAGRFETVTSNGKQYTIGLRYKHIYKPYSMHLIDVRFDRYMGTQTAKSYSSELQLVDPTRKVRRHVRIWMNNPLRFAGETFYQSNYGRDSASGLEYTGLQVVTNRSWRIPYLACMMTSFGMLAQFWLVLTQFLRRRESNRLQKASVGESKTVAKNANRPTRSRRKRSQPDSSSSRPSNRAEWLVPAAIVLICGLWLLSKAYQPGPKPGKMDLVAFGRLPVMYEGRVKPFDTLARNSLRIISDKQTVKDEQGRTTPAIRWLLDVITDRDVAMHYRVFRIQNLDVLETLGLERRKGFRYALSEFQDHLDAFDKQVRQAYATAPEKRDLLNSKILELNRRLQLFLMLRESFRAPHLDPDHLRDDIRQEQQRRERLANYTLPLAVPPAEGAGDWQAYTHAVFQAMARRMMQQKPNPATLALVQILSSYSDQDAAAFNQAVNGYREQLESHRPPQWNERKTDFEVFYNHFEPFFYSMLLYFLAFVLACLAWFGWSRPLNRASFWLIALTLVVHTLALVARMYISGRPPVTNLYSSALFIGWGCVILGIILERAYRLGIGNIIASVSGFTVLLVAFLLTTAVTSFKGDTFTVLVAVLDTQFWLATHVTCITLGYSTTFVAGLLGIVYVLRGTLTRSLSSEEGDAISRMIFGTLCFALFFSFVGTVLGGLWADDSWGRFWGWDPKENGALIIVFWNALVLHALGGKMIKQRGLAVLAILGNVVTAWSWFGVNELGVGLHSYGFTEGVLFFLGLFVLSQMVLVAIGLIPGKRWRSRPDQA